MFPCELLHTKPFAPSSGFRIGTVFPPRVRAYGTGRGAVGNPALEAVRGFRKFP